MQQHLKIFGIFFILSCGLNGMDGDGGALVKSGSGSKRSSRTASPLKARPASPLSAVLADSPTAPRRSLSETNLSSLCSVPVAAAASSSSQSALAHPLLVSPANASTASTTRSASLSDSSDSIYALQYFAQVDNTSFDLGVNNSQFSSEQITLVKQLQSDLKEDIGGLEYLAAASTTVPFNRLTATLATFLITSRNEQERLSQQLDEAKGELAKRPTAEYIQKIELDLKAARAEVERLKAVGAQRPGSSVYSPAPLSKNSAPSLLAAATAATLTPSLSSSSATTPTTPTTATPERGGAFSPTPAAPGSAKEDAQNLQTDLTTAQRRVADLEKRLTFFKQFYLPSTAIIGGSVGFLIRHFGPMLFPYAK